VRISRVETAPPESRSQTRLLVFLAISAAILAVALPPMGLAAGICTLIVLAVRRRRKVAMPQPIFIVVIATGVFAIFVGGVLSILLALFGSETAAFRECLAGANTRVAQQVCQDEFADAVRNRILR
jgi:hypothetical protein